MLVKLKVIATTAQTTWSEISAVKPHVIVSIYVYSDTMKHLESFPSILSNYSSINSAITLISSWCPTKSLMISGFYLAEK